MSSKSTSYIVENRNKRMHWFYKNHPANIPLRQTRLLADNILFKGPCAEWHESGGTVVHNYHPAVRAVFYDEIEESVDWGSSLKPAPLVVKCSRLYRLDKNLRFIEPDVFLKGMSEALEKPGTPYQKVGYFLAWFRDIRASCRAIANAKGYGTSRCWGFGATDDCMLQKLCTDLLFTLADYDADPEYPNGKRLNDAPFPNHSFIDTNGETYFKTKALNVNTKVLKPDAAARHPLERAAFFENSAALKQGLEHLSASELLYLQPNKWEIVPPRPYSMTGEGEILHKYGVPIVARSIPDNDAISQHYFWIATLLRQEKLDIHAIRDPAAVVEELRLHAGLYSGIVDFIETTATRFNTTFGQVVEQTFAWIQTQENTVVRSMEHDRIECIRHLTNTSMCTYAESLTDRHIPLLVERCLKRGLGDCAAWLSYVPLETVVLLEKNIHPDLRISDMITSIEMLYSKKPRAWGNVEQASFRELLLNQWHSLQTDNKGITIVDISSLDL